MQWIDTKDLKIEKSSSYSFLWGLIVASKEHASEELFGMRLSCPRTYATLAISRFIDITTFTLSSRIYKRRCNK